MSSSNRRWWTGVAFFASAMLCFGCTNPPTPSAAQGQPTSISPSKMTPQPSALAATASANGPSASGTPSATGQLIVYQDEKAPGTNTDTVYVATSEGLDGHAILNLPGLNDQHPDWSPDGAQITFSHEVFGSKSIWVAGADGSNPRAIYDNPPEMPWAEFPAWSRDGRRIVAVTYSDEPNVHVAARSALVIIDPSTGKSEQAAVIENQNEMFAYPRWSPDGDGLVASVGVFSEDRSAWIGEKLVVIRRGAAGWGQPASITDPKMFGSYPDWHPDQDLIVFVSPDRGWFWSLGDNSGINAVDFPDAFNLYTIRSDGTELRAVTRYPADGSIPPRDAAGQPTWTPDGRIIFINRDEDVIHDAFINADGTGLIVLPLTKFHPRLQPRP